MSEQKTIFKLKTRRFVRVCDKKISQNMENNRIMYSLCCHKPCVNNTEQTHLKEPSLLSWRLR